MQRPRCSMKLPKIFLSISPRCRPLWMLMLVVAAVARPADRIRGADAEAAKTVLREMSNAASQNVLLLCQLLFYGLSFCRSRCLALRRLPTTGLGIYSDKSF